MVQSPPKLITVDEFITNYGDSDCYELIDGELTEMEPTGPHEQVSGFLGRKVRVRSRKLSINSLPEVFLKKNTNLVVDSPSILTSYQNLLN
ncbi:Uma2 family endonuclease [Microcoleus sp. N3A4]|uniref:hypothetical protein n=1 Tax=Microcoleus sp. N3A4 TaxID=3055379 RepID=UPI002FD6A66F